ncbi:hypothetical protein [Aquisalinus flavus]|uniref:YbjN domain-containing protein n=1 Tax=Aquisalinus flavus TaxID=1526572 RepID=A0A8J2V4T4_9PROT|nr:hypothetical protein [Aquisalinus flavus]MBD0427355.1 hypothetical protein [Aquisalinus flavus]UNE47160.1 YbjN domain-containing protein [Aquisalinus flavus]GGD00370.1 hypothetical protein GCM10011342_06700 [Aquisalinus flavus]
MNKLAVTFSAACMAVAGMVLPATAQMNSLGASSDASMIFDFNVETLSPLLSDAGVAHSLGDLNGQQAIQASYNGENVILLPTACNEGRCVGLAMFTFLNSGLSAEQNDRFNNTLFFASAENWYDNTGSQSVLERYLIADYGYSKRTFAVDLIVFFSVLENYRVFASASMVEASFGEGASRTAAAETGGKISNAVTPSDLSSPHAVNKQELRSIAYEMFQQGKDGLQFQELMDE